MLPLNPALLDCPGSPLDYPVELEACLNSHGLYHPRQFVLRLSPEVHRKIGVLPKGITKDGVDFEGLQAHSTYLHETIHWWQHIGSTIGLILSLSYPVQAHVNYPDLRDFLARVGPKKSILRWIETTQLPESDANLRLANAIVNTHFDIEFFRIRVSDPNLARQVAHHPIFRSLGHAYSIAYTTIVRTLQITCGLEFESFFPNPVEWAQEFRALEVHPGSDYDPEGAVRVPPIGARDIFEGQARFAQLQYLHLATGRKLEWEDAKTSGMLATKYRVAIEFFIRTANIDWPASIGDPVVGLFLLICDLALNPDAGFPSRLNFDRLLESVDPGHRFLALSIAIRNHPELAAAVREHSREEYAHLSEVLSKSLGTASPLAVVETVSEWEAKSDRLKALIAEYRTFAFGPENQAVRLLFAHFLSFCRDKLDRPEFFCWPGAWLVGEERVSPDIGAVFERQAAPFIDKEDDDGIFPREMPDRDDQTVHATFTAFYGMNVIYDMTRQWVAMRGEFDYNYRWLSTTLTASELRKWVADQFETVYGAHPDLFQIL